MERYSFWADVKGNTELILDLGGLLRGVVTRDGKRRCGRGGNGCEEGRVGERDLRETMWPKGYRHRSSNKGGGEFAVEWWGRFGRAGGSVTTWRERVRGE